MYHQPGLGDGGALSCASLGFSLLICTCGLDKTGLILQDRDNL